MITQTLPDRLLINLFLQYFGAGAFKCALYTSDAALDATTPSYTSIGEVSGAGYTAGGLSLTKAGGYPTIQGGTAYMHFVDPEWPNASFTARGAMIYNGGTGDAVALLDFSRDFTAVAQTFRIKLGTTIVDALLRATRGQ